MPPQVCVCANLFRTVWKAKEGILMSHNDLGVATVSATEGSGVDDALAEAVLSIIAEVTRYPREVLQWDAGLEEELGIDSVKRVEILTVIRARLKLPETEDV